MLEEGAGKSREVQGGSGKRLGDACRSRICMWVHRGAGRCREVQGGAGSAGRFWEELEMQELQ